VWLLAALAGAQQPAWRQRQATLPAPGGSATTAELAYDAARKVVVAVVQDTPVQQTWEYDGDAWTQAQPAQSPAAGECELAFDPTRGRVLCVTGSATTGALQVLEWTGSDWLPHSTASSPAANSGFAIAFDDARAHLVLHGGNKAVPPPVAPALAETWAWDGTDWRQVGNGGPVPCLEHGMAYDSARQRVVFFGGRTLPAPGTSVTLADTWEWSGQQWIQHFGIAAPPPRSLPAMTFDSARGVTVLFGGVASGGTPLTDLWEWNGMTWTQVATPGAPPAPGPIAYDAERNVAVALAFNGTELETWEYAATTSFPASVTPFGAGCAGSGGVPSMDAAGPPVLNQLYSVSVTNLPPSPIAAVFGLIGVSNTTWAGLPLPFELVAIGMPGCSFLVSVDFVVPLPISAGSATWNLQIPDEPMLLGGTFYQQALVSDPGTSPRFGSVSNALAATIGTQ
jgi:hypothetical protein